MNIVCFSSLLCTAIFSSSDVHGLLSACLVLIPHTLSGSYQSERLRLFPLLPCRLQGHVLGKTAANKWFLLHIVEQPALDHVQLAPLRFLFALGTQEKDLPLNMGFRTGCGCVGASDRRWH